MGRAENGQLRINPVARRQVLAELSEEFTEAAGLPALFSDPPRSVLAGHLESPDVPSLRRMQDIEHL
jgi:hypothetical protein